MITGVSVLSSQDTESNTDFLYIQILIARWYIIGLGVYTLPKNLKSDR